MEMKDISGKTHPRPRRAYEYTDTPHRERNLDKIIELLPCKMSQYCMMYGNKYEYTAS